MKPSTAMARSSLLALTVLADAEGCDDDSGMGTRIDSSTKCIFADGFAGLVPESVGGRSSRNGAGWSAMLAVFKDSSEVYDLTLMLPSLIRSLHAAAPTCEHVATALLSLRHLRFAGGSATIAALLATIWPPLPARQSGAKVAAVSRPSSRHQSSGSKSSCGNGTSSAAAWAASLLRMRPLGASLASTPSKSSPRSPSAIQRILGLQVVSTRRRKTSDMHGCDDNLGLVRVFTSQHGGLAAASIAASGLAVKATDLALFVQFCRSRGTRSRINWWYDAGQAGTLKEPRRDPGANADALLRMGALSRLCCFHEGSDVTLSRQRHRVRLLMLPHFLKELVVLDVFDQAAVDGALIASNAFNVPHIFGPSHVHAHVHAYSRSSSDGCFYDERGGSRSCRLKMAVALGMRCCEEDALVLCAMMTAENGLGACLESHALALAVYLSAVEKRDSVVSNTFRGALVSTLAAIIPSSRTARQHTNQKRSGCALSTDDCGAQHAQARDDDNITRIMDQCDDVLSSTGSFGPFWPLLTLAYRALPVAAKPVAPALAPALVFLTLGADIALECNQAAPPGDDTISPPQTTSSASMPRTARLVGTVVALWSNRARGRSQRLHALQLT